MLILTFGRQFNDVVQNPVGRLPCRSLDQMQLRACTLPSFETSFTRIREEVEVVDVAPPAFGQVGNKLIFFK